MIIVKLKGGLGNQMFQYAFGRYLSLKKKRCLRLDMIYIKKDNRREYELDKFGIIKNRTHFLEEVFYFILNKIHRFIPFYKYIKYSSEKFNPKIMKIKSPILYLDGYWQSEKYFEEISEIIRAEFKLVTKLDEKNKKILKLIKKSNSVAIHLRRRDYVSDPEVKEFFGNCSMNYYKKGIEIIEKKVNNPKYFIFSDDISWVKDNFNLVNSPIFVDINDFKNGFEDLRLMKNCKHFIIANSSFSWWGAWLSKNEKKIVITPKIWIQSHPNSDIVPNRWIRI